MTIPRIWEALHDDYAGSPFQWEPITHPCVAYVLVWDQAVGREPELIGMVIMGEHSKTQVEVHNALFPWIGWKTRKAAAREMFDWLWKAGRKRIIGKALSGNRYALKFNQAIGMELFGVNKQSVMKHGELCDENWFGISPPCGEGK